MSSIMDNRNTLGHNGGPALEDAHVPPWGKGAIGSYFYWKKARRAAFKVSREVALMRLERARRIGLTYEEYTLEILDRGRHLQPEDVERIAEIKQARRQAASGSDF